MKYKIVLLLTLLLLLSGCWTIVQNGKHFGQVTAIEDVGLFWKTTRVYIKTDISFSQEESYCLDKTHPDYLLIEDRIKDFAASRQKIIIYYHDELVIAPWRCDGEEGIIDKVTIQ